MWQQQGEEKTDEVRSDEENQGKMTKGMGSRASVPIRARAEATTLFGWVGLVRGCCGAGGWSGLLGGRECLRPPWEVMGKDSVGSQGKACSVGETGAIRTWRQ